MYYGMYAAFGLSAIAAGFATRGIIVCICFKSTVELVAETQRWIMIMGFFFLLGINLGGII